MRDVQQAIEDIRKGKIIIVTDDHDRENEGDLVCAADYATPENINFMVTHGKGLVCTPISNQIAQKLDLTPMLSANTDAFTTNFTYSIDAKTTTTGISTKERSMTILKMIQSGSSGADFQKPGHIFPLISVQGGVLKRNGHTEAAVDLAKLAGLSAAGVICEIVGDDGEMLFGKKLNEYAAKHKLTKISIAQLIEYIERHEHPLEFVAQSKLPTKYGLFNIAVFKNPISNVEQVAVSLGHLNDQENLLTRVHSECLTGDIFGSIKCDCGQQLEKALQDIQQEKKGLLIYLRDHEGRGIGIGNKIKAYNLQDQGEDTISANSCLKLPIDARKYDDAAQIIRLLNVKSIKLETNNPDKIHQLEKYGIKITDRISAEVNSNELNYEYLKTKKEKMKHMLELNKEQK
jgi:3,4-dihydroxy 2-butanone 4-phosphate synthase/GTP cyclohydrolase II